jgi:hypothetical protein
MSTLQLPSRLADYDKYGEYRTCAIKGLFVVELMFIFNLIYGVENPYFFYFYIPLTSFAAEIAGNNLKEKYLFLFFTLSGSTILVFCYGLFSEYRTFFIFFVFFSSLLIYYIAIKKVKSLFVPAPIILSLAAYSLNYLGTDSNLYIALNNALHTVAASIIIFIGLYFFPKSFYYAIWKRAFCGLLDHLDNVTEKIKNNELSEIPLFKGVVVMTRYSEMVSKKMKTFSILKITHLSFHLVMELSYLTTFQKKIRQADLLALQHYVKSLSRACKKEIPLELSAHDTAVLSDREELNTLYRIILSWTPLNCLKD